ncbi:UDP-N-acetylmuramoyl-L-alanyl-D-glutamate--2,6-diaminopimelate ligase [Sciscionella sediminilitoris]|uniref:UDP-N-acetylmuramoyl-L-alanyl-D-glutamate--2, 6-diaminopimelate ligase n=1 Tax=Sciscionella sediminilitoris TaxID=1445613 RepID=UPI00068A1BFC|nr:UDP-N-acetylmuramoyl-L-alanyl-D-glutamate--2,6-diaminopimelate ligase [Sciscionella sp. SE31]
MVNKLASAAGVGKVAAPPPRPARTTPVDVGALAAAAGARLTGTTDALVTGVTLRAQHVLGGDLFAALPGANVHGGKFSDAAHRGGAAAILTDPAGAVLEEVTGTGLPVLVHEDPRAVLGELAAQVYGNPSEHLAVLGVTGTSGKTTTSYLVQAGLAAAGRTTGLVGTVETRVAGERLPSAFTTPEAPDMQALLAVMVERGVTDVAMEVSSHSLVMHRVGGIRFAVGAFSNLSQDHLDFHRDMEDYFQAKAKLFDGRSGTEIVNVDGEWGRRLVRSGTITVRSTEDGPDALWSASRVRSLPDGGQSFIAHGPLVDFEVALRLPGSYNVANAILAAAVLYSAGVPVGDIAHGLSSVDVPGRMERVDAGQSFTAVVDYSHKPAAVEFAIGAVRTQLERSGSGGRIIVVLGCGGDRDRGKRPQMGAVAARMADVLVVTDDNPRSEDPSTIRKAMLEGAYAVPEGERGEVLEIGDRRAAITEAVSRAGERDVLVVAGKGHETGQEIEGVVHPFSDRDELEAAIRRAQ